MTRAIGAEDEPTCNQKPGHRILIPHNGHSVSFQHLFRCQPFVFAHLAGVTVRKQKNLIKQQGEIHVGQRSEYTAVLRGAV